MILLDTCALIWLAADPEMLGDAARTAILRVEDSVFVSPITIFEIGQKQISGKLILPAPVEEWFPAILARHQLSEIHLSARIAATASNLPPLHKDPFDRLLIATAMEHRLTLLTPDQHIRQYPGIATLW